MTAWPPGDGIIKAGTGPPCVPGRGLLRGRPRPRFTKRGKYNILWCCYARIQDNMYLDKCFGDKKFIIHNYYGSLQH